MVDTNKLQNILNGLKLQIATYNKTPRNSRPDWRTTMFAQAKLLYKKSFVKNNIKHTVYFVVTAVPCWVNMINDIVNMPYSSADIKDETALKQDYFDYLVDQENYNGAVEDVDWSKMWQSDLFLMFNRIERQENLENGVVNEADDYISYDDLLNELDVGDIQTN